MSSRTPSVGELCLTMRKKKKKKKKEERKKMTKSEFYSDSSLDSHVLSGTFKSVFVNC